MMFRGSMRDKFKDEVIKDHYPIRKEELKFLSSEQRQNRITKAGALGLYDKLSYTGDKRFIIKCLCEDEHVTIPDIATGIFNEAFVSKLNLRSIKLNEHLMYIDVSAFHGCISLRDVELPEGLRIIHEGAFRSCEGLNEIVLPSTLEKIGMYSIKNCCNLKRIVIQNNIIKIDDIKKAINWAGIYDMEVEVVIVDKETKGREVSSIEYAKLKDTIYSLEINVVYR